jgi:hypothetical protein
VDPAYEIALAAPIRSGRLLLIRAVAVLTTTTLLAGVAAPFLPTVGLLAAAWLLPALATTAATLALSTVAAPGRAASAVAGGWLALVILVESSQRPLATFGVTGQLLALAVTCAAIGLLIVRRDRLELAVSG